MPFTPFGRTALLKHITGHTSWTMPSSLKVGLHTSDPGTDGTTGLYATTTAPFQYGNDGGGTHYADNDQVMPTAWTPTEPTNGSGPRYWSIRDNAGNVLVVGGALQCTTVNEGTGSSALVAATLGFNADAAASTKRTATTLTAVCDAENGDVDIAASSTIVIGASCTVGVEHYAEAIGTLTMDGVCATDILVLSAIGLWTALCSPDPLPTTYARAFVEFTLATSATVRI